MATTTSDSKSVNARGLRRDKRISWQWSVRRRELITWVPLLGLPIRLILAGLCGKRSVPLDALWHGPGASFRRNAATMGAG